MRCEIENRGEISIVRLEGEMRGESDDHEWTKDVIALIDGGTPRIIIDLAGVLYVSSAGLGQLVRVTALANSQGAKLTLAELSPFVAGVLVTTGLGRFFDVAPTVDAAIARAS